MKRFFASGSSRAERPAELLGESPASSSAGQPANSFVSAEQPDFKIASIRDVQRWLAAEHVATSSNVDAQRIREAMAVLSQCRPRKEDVQLLQSKWQVAQKKDKKPRPLGEVLQEFESKVVEAAQKLQQQLADAIRLQSDLPSVTGSAEQPASVNPLMEVSDDPVLADLKERQRKRMSETATEQQRPTAKAKAGKRQTKRGLNLSSSSVEQPGAKKKEPRLSAESFAACAAPPGALDAPEAASSSSAAQSVQQLKRTLGRLEQELKKLDGMAWIVADDQTELKRLTDAVCTLHGLKVSSHGWIEVLEHPSIKLLYKPQCGALKVAGHRQNLDYLWVVACRKLQSQVATFAELHAEIIEDNYPWLCQVKQEAHDAVLNSLPEMAVSPEQLMQTLKDTKGENGAPFGRLPPSYLIPYPDHFVRWLACLELPDAFYAHLPGSHVDLVDKVVQHRRSRADSSAGQPALITTADIKDVLHDFSTDCWSNEAKKRWLFDVLNTPKQSQQKFRVLARDL